MICTNGLEHNMEILIFDSTYFFFIISLKNVNILLNNLVGIEMQRHFGVGSATKRALVQVTIDQSSLPLNVTIILYT